MSVQEPSGWQKALLSDLGAPATAANIELENAWFDEEHGGPGINPHGLMGGVNQGGAYNPFDTTLGSPEAGGGAPKGSSVYNSVGVMNYPSASVGIQETVRTLEEPAYANLLSGIRSGHDSLQTLEELENQSPWGSAFTNPSNTPWGVPGTGSGTMSASLTSFPGGGWDPLNWPAEAASGAASGISGVMNGLFKILLEITFVGLGAGLIIVGGYKAAGKDLPSPPKPSAGDLAALAA
ncbi:MAG: hypothetical protein ACYDDZ_10975 [Acidimicrobiales bacterium]